MENDGPDDRLLVGDVVGNDGGHENGFWKEIDLKLYIFKRRSPRSSSITSAIPAPTSSPIVATSRASPSPILAATSRSSPIAAARTASRTTTVTTAASGAAFLSVSGSRSAI